MEHNSYYKKGGETQPKPKPKTGKKSKPKEPQIVRYYFEDEPFEYAKGGATSNYSSITIKADYPKYKRKPAFTTYYKVDTSKTYPIGGRAEDGYRLLFKDGKKSDTYITIADLQKIAKGESVDSDGVTMSKSDKYAKGGEVGKWTYEKKDGQYILKNNQKAVRIGYLKDQSFKVVNDLLSKLNSDKSDNYSVSFYLTNKGAVMDMDLFDSVFIGYETEKDEDDRLNVYGLETPIANYIGKMKMYVNKYHIEENEMYAKGGTAKPKPTNKEVYENGDVVDSYPSDVGGSNASIDYIIDFNGKQYIVTVDEETEKVINPNKTAQINDNDEFAKGGTAKPKPKKGKKRKPKEPKIIRGWVDDEPYYYEKGGSTKNCWCYDIGGL